MLYFNSWWWLKRTFYSGDQSVGKTSIITRFMYDKFDSTYQVICYSLSPFAQSPCPAHTHSMPLSPRLPSESTSCRRPCILTIGSSGCSYGIQQARYDSEATNHCSSLKKCGWRKRFLAAFVQKSTSSVACRHRCCDVGLPLRWRIRCPMAQSSLLSLYCMFHEKVTSVGIKDAHNVPHHAFFAGLSDW